MFLSKLHLFKSGSPNNCGIKQYKNGCPGTFPIFLPKWGPRFWNKPRFWNTFAADQLVFQNRGFTVSQNEAKFSNKM